MADRLTLEKYGCLWNPVTDPAVIEMTMIRHGGQWTKKDGRLAGNGLFYHYRALQSLLWPEDDHHRWSDLMLKEFLTNNITAVLGPKDSSKTHTMSKFGLTDYFLFPNETLVMISSTDMRGLEYRVWGDLKNMFQRARERYPWLPGFLIDSKKAICTQNIHEEQVRDMRKGIVCFPEGTLVDTPSGQRRIETLKCGDHVTNASGIGTVRRIHINHASDLVRVKLSNGKTIDCTPEHPFLTSRGWTKAIDMMTCDVVYSAHETMSLLQESHWSRLSESEVLQCPLPIERNASEMRRMRKGIPSLETSERTVLQPGLCGSMDCKQARTVSETHSQVRSLRHRIRWSKTQDILLSFLPTITQDIALRRMRENVSIYSAFPVPAPKAVLQCILQMEMDESKDWRESSLTDRSGVEIEEPFSRFSPSFQSQDRKKIIAKQRALLRNRRCLSSNSTRGRDRRWSSQDTRETTQRCFENERTPKTWVESVTILESSSDRRFDESKGGYLVYNLQVEGHPSYSVEGIIVHNCIPCLSSTGQWLGLGRYVGIKQKRRKLLSDECQFMRPAFLEALANLNSGDFKGVFVGNPIGENDPLDKVSEPKDGWASIGLPTKTTIWSNRFLNGKTINLVGTDSPNFDFPQDPKPRFPYLINQKEIDKVVAFYQKDSIQYFSQCLGIRRSGIEGHRVITRQLCDQFNAFKDAVWYDTYQTRIYGVDAAYGNLGGDRCVGGYIEFGKDVDGKTVMRVNPPVIIPVSVMLQKIPEDQIAEYVKNDCESLGIPPENVFFDATGRGSLGTSFARVWSPMVNPVEFGGKASTRPVTNDLYTFDPAIRRQRLKRCDEEYRKFVTELWFSVKYVIMSEQMCNLPLEVMEEFCLREWKTVEGNRTEIESKQETKLRMGRSPDLADWLATCVEGARQRGFIISSTANEEMESTDHGWKRELEEYQRSLSQSSQLNHGALA